jgi:hypothetical protein
MSAKTITAALIAAAFIGGVASVSARAQTYGGGPGCGLGHYDRTTGSCVSDSSRHEARAHHAQLSAHRARIASHKHKNAAVASASQKKDLQP